jgi:hypothetical protein
VGANYFEYLGSGHIQLGGAGATLV